MRYQNVIQIYWKKGFFFAGNLFYFENTFSDVLSHIIGFGKTFKKKLISRFELTITHKNFNKKMPEYEIRKKRIIIKPLNIIFSQINSVNNNYYEIKRLNIIRKFLIKSYQGRCHALGKPVRGQRTWSNSWNSYNTNKILRLYISETSKQLKSKTLVEKINYKLVKKKYTSKLKKRKEKKIKKSIWF